MSGKAARMKGIRWEREVARYLGTTRTANTRPGLHDDAADVVLPGWLVECKDVGRWDVPGWWRHLLAKRRGAERPVLVLKRRQQPTAEALVVLRLEDFERLRKGDSDE